MKKKVMKITTLVTAAIALVVVTVLVTVAFLTSSSAVSNTFTVGSVGIQMFESKVDADGKKIADTDTNGAMKDSDGNSYHLIPGKSYDKDPTIYVDAKSDDSYLFVKVRNNLEPIEYGTVVTENNADKPTIKQQMAANGWQYFVETSTGTVYVYTGVGTGENGELTEEELKAVNDGAREAVKVEGGAIIDVFEAFTIAEHADVSLYGGAKVTLTAFAVQSDTFVDDTTEDGKTAVQKAWDAIVVTYPYEGGATASE